MCVGEGVEVNIIRGQLARMKPVFEKHLPPSRLGMSSDRQDGETSLNTYLH